MDEAGFTEKEGFEVCMGDSVSADSLYGEERAGMFRVERAVLLKATTRMESLQAGMVKEWLTIQTT